MTFQISLSLLPKKHLDSNFVVVPNVMLSSVGEDIFSESNSGNDSFYVPKKPLELISDFKDNYAKNVRKEGLHGSIEVFYDEESKNLQVDIFSNHPQNLFHKLSQDYNFSASKIKRISNN